MMAVTFFTQSIRIIIKPNFKSKQHKCDNKYIKELKQHTKCFKCGEFGHWSIECPPTPNEKEGKTFCEKMVPMLSKQQHFFLKMKRCVHFLHKVIIDAHLKKPAFD
jgi:hypothetical protein